jgi:hypothetical protein
MKRYLMCVFAILALCIPQWTAAAPIEYEISGFGSGRVGTSDFSNQAFDIHLIGDPNGQATYVDVTTAFIKIAAIGTTTLLASTGLGFSSTLNLVYFTEITPSNLYSTDLLDFNTSGLLNLNRPFSVQGSNVNAQQFIDIPSALGLVTFTAASSIQFSAASAPAAPAVVPVPAAVSLFASAIAAMAAMGRRRINK